MLSINGQIRATDSGLELVLENQHITNTTEQKFDKFFSHNNKQYHIQFDLKNKKEEGDNFVIPINLLQRESEKELHGVNMKNALGLKDNKKEISVELHSSLKKSKEASANRTPPRSVSSSPKNVSPINSLSGSSSSLELNKTSTENNAKVEELEQENTNLQTKLTQAEQEKQKLEAAKQQAEDKQKELETTNQKIEQDKKALEDAKKVAEQEKATLQTEFDTANKKLKDQNAEVEKLTQKNKELENQKSQVQQPKPSNGAKYTATVGMGLAAGLVAFTALERTVRLEMLVMVGIAVASAIVAGGITCAVLPSTQVDGAKAQGVNGNGKGK